MGAISSATPGQRWANPNLDLDLNPDLTNFPNQTGFGLDLKIFKAGDLDLSFFKVVDLDLDLDLNSSGFGFDISKSTNPPHKNIEVITNFSIGMAGQSQCNQAA